MDDPAPRTLLSLVVNMEKTALQKVATGRSDIQYGDWEFEDSAGLRNEYAPKSITGYDSIMGDEGKIAALTGKTVQNGKGMDSDALKRVLSFM